MLLIKLVTAKRRKTIVKLIKLIKSSHTPMTKKNRSKGENDLRATVIKDSQKRTNEKLSGQQTKHTKKRQTKVEKPKSGEQIVRQMSCKLKQWQVNVLSVVSTL